MILTNLLLCIICALLGLIFWELHKPNEIDIVAAPPVVQHPPTPIPPHTASHLHYPGLALELITAGGTHFAEVHTHKYPELPEYHQHAGIWYRLDPDQSLSVLRDGEIAARYLESPEGPPSLPAVWADVPSEDLTNA